MIRNIYYCGRLDNFLDTDDLEPQSKKKDLKNLETLSIEALHTYISELNDEIQRVKITLENKESAKEKADTFFKT